MARRPGGGFWVADDGTGGEAPPAPPFTHVAPRLQPPNHAITRVGDAYGRLIGQLFGDIESISWRGDGYGTATMLFSPAVRRSRPNLLEIGNRLRIDFTNGLRPWVGVIDTPQELAGGVLRVQAYEPAYLLGLRLTRRSARFSSDGGRTAPTIARQLLSHLERHPIHVAEIHGHGAPATTPLEMNFSFETVLGALEKIRDADPWFHYHCGEAYQYGAGVIEFQMYLYRGAWSDDTDRAVLQQGINFAQVQILDQGPIVNRVVVASGDADIDGDDEQVDNELPTRPPWRPHGRYNPVYYPHTGTGLMLSAQLPGDTPPFGRREQLVTLSDVTGEDVDDPGVQMESYATTYLDRYSVPSRRVSGVSLNLSPGLWRNFGVGSLVRLRVTDAAGIPTEQTMQVQGVDFTPAAGTLALVLFSPTEEQL